MPSLPGYFSLLSEVGRGGRIGEFNEPGFETFRLRKKLREDPFY